MNEQQHTPADMTLIKNGDTVLIFGRGDRWDGQEGKYVGPDGNGGRHHVIIAGEDLYFFPQYIALPAVPERVLGGVTVPANVTLDEALAIIERVGNDLEDRKRAEASVRSSLTSALQQRDQYQSDLAITNSFMKDEIKGEQSWCDDGYNGVVDRLNRLLVSDFTFDRARRLVKKTVSLRGETTVDTDVWVYEDEDEDDTDNWKDEDGDEISDPDEFMQTALKDEFSRCRSEFDTVEVQ